MSELKERLEKIKSTLKVEELQEQIAQIEQESAQPEFWADHQKAGQKMQELAELQKIVEEIKDLEFKINRNEYTGNGKRELEQKLEKLELQTYLSGKYDKGNAILTIQAGQGGTEAMDWTAMLLRMYLKYCDSQNWKTKILEESSGEEAGLKSVSLEVRGNYSYGYLKNEHGAHRLVRKSPFNADHLRQTSFARVEVVPFLQDDTDLELNPADVEVQTFRSSGPGGQHANKTESAVRAIHTPTGLSVKISSSRSQLTNRKAALNLLRGKLYQYMQEQKVERIQELKGQYTPPTWGTQIRSYVLDPYQLVKDHRTGVEIPQAENVLDGELGKLLLAHT